MSLPLKRSKAAFSFLFTLCGCVVLLTKVFVYFQTTRFDRQRLGQTGKGKVSQQSGSFYLWDTGKQQALSKMVIVLFSFTLRFIKQQLWSCQWSLEGILFHHGFFQKHTMLIFVLPGQAVPGGLSTGVVRGGEGADLRQAERGVRVDGWGRLHGHHQAAEREAVSVKEPVQGHVFQSGRAAQVARPPSRSWQHAQHLQLLPEVSVEMKRWRSYQDLLCWVDVHISLVKFNYIGICTFSSCPDYGLIFLYPVKL